MQMSEKMKIAYLSNEVLDENTNVNYKKLISM